MPYIHKVHINTTRTHPFPFDVAAIKYAKHLDFSGKLNFIIGDNGTGKSTLLETIAFRLQLPHIDGSEYSKKAFNAAVTLSEFLELQFAIDRPTGFFFRAEDFGDYINSIDRSDERLHSHLKSLEGEVPDHIIQQMKDNSNFQLYHVRRNYGQELGSFSHGEAYLKIMKEKLQRPGIYLLDEPEAALSPSRQLALIAQILGHLKKNMSQFIIATHSPILMAMPNAKIYEITDENMIHSTLEETEHYRVTKSFLNNPELYLRHLEE